jgi:hypothetical protein
MKRRTMLAVLGCVGLAGCQKPEGKQAAAPVSPPAAATAPKPDEQALKKQLQAYTVRLANATTAAKWDEALSVLDEMRKALPPAMAPELDSMKFSTLLNKGDAAGATAQARAMAGSCEVASILNDVAWELVTAAEFKERDLDLAEKIAAKANALAKESDPETLATLARIAFMKGSKDKAAALQQQAIAKATEAEAKQDLQADLDDYKAGKLPSLDDAPETE